MDWAKALLLEVRPLPTLAAMTAGVTGLAMGGSVAGWPVYAALIAVVLFASHMKDAYVDWYVRGEDRLYPWGPFPETGDLIGRRGMFAAIGGALVAFGGILVSLHPAPPAFFAVALAGAAMALLYAPVLDKRALGSAFSYPTGVGLAIVGGGLLAAGRVVPATLAYAPPLVVTLAGAKIVEDLIDADHDAELGKTTVPVALGPERARRLGYGLVAAGMLPLVLLGPLVAVGVVGGLALVTASSILETDRGIYLLVAGVYVAMAAVLAWTLI